MIIVVLLHLKMIFLNNKRYSVFKKNQRNKYLDKCNEKLYVVSVAARQGNNNRLTIRIFVY